jgi:hypothetical protein
MKVERDGDDICLAFLLKQELFGSGWEQTFEGEVSGVVGAGAFVRFRGEMSDAYEGFLPARLVRGDHYELNDLDSALIGVRTGRRMGFGDPVEVRVESLEPARGRVTLEPGGEEQRRRGARPGTPKGQTRGKGKPKGAPRDEGKAKGQSRSGGKPKRANRDKGKGPKGKGQNRDKGKPKRANRDKGKPKGRGGGSSAGGRRGERGGGK